jgi:hypothetical protein
MQHRHSDMYIMNNWTYEAYCKLTSFPISDLENFKRLIFVAHSVHKQAINQYR